MSSLVLGTAQLGLRYGIANITGKPSFPAARSIIQEAWQQGIREFDTAQDYGNSEYILGGALNDLGVTQSARVISKLSHHLDLKNSVAISASIEKTLKNLKIPRLYGLLLHDEQLLNQWDIGLKGALRALVSAEKIDYIGVSVYSPEWAIHALQMHGIDIVQIPSNLFDQRFVQAGVIALAKTVEKQLYIRSVYLQGLFFLDPEQSKLPVVIEHARPLLRTLKVLSERSGYSIAQLAIGYVRAIAPEAKILIGAERPDQVQESASCTTVKLPGELVSTIQNMYAKVDEKIVNPSYWK